jgi:hypothetical protein
VKKLVTFLFGITEPKTKEKLLNFGCEKNIENVKSKCEKL